MVTDLNPLARFNAMAIKVSVIQPSIPPPIQVNPDDVAADGGCGGAAHDSVSCGEYRGATVSKDIDTAV